MTVVAAIDCGTNAVRLLVARSGGSADSDHPAGAAPPLVDVVRRLEITRLGQGVDRTGVLDPAAVARTVDVLAGYAEQARALGAQRIRLVATSASRDAANGAQFTAVVAQRTGLQPEVITGSEEAELCYAGAVGAVCRADAGRRPDFLLLDIGGGSTELVRGSGPTGAEVSAAVSVDVGCVRLTERHLHHDPARPEELAALRADARQGLATAACSVPLFGAGTVVATAGTATTVAAVHLGLPAYDPGRIHGTVLARADVRRIAADLEGMPRSERAAIPSMHPGRVDVIVAGAAILDEALAAAASREVLVSECDILDGIAARLAADRTNASGPAAPAAPAAEHERT